MWQARPLLAFAALAALLVVTSPMTAQQLPKAPEKHVSLAGQLLVATPSMEDRRFERTVILMARHDKDGAFGLIINRPAAERSLSELLEHWATRVRRSAERCACSRAVRCSPSSASSFTALTTRRPQTLEVDGRVAVTMSRDILRDIGTGKGPQKSMILFGYAGWAPGQLEGELARRSWTTAPADRKLIFDEDRSKLWDIVYALRIQDL